MAKNKSLFHRRSTGSYAGITFSQHDGVTCLSEKVVENKSKSFRQMRNRVAWSNRIALWRAFYNTLKPSFESKGINICDYNMFVKINKGVKVYLTRGEYEQGACVVAPYQITRGSLKSVAVSDGTGGVKRTDIALGSTFAITSATTVKAFSLAVIDHNRNFLNGDQITFYKAEQTVDAVTGVPHTDISAEYIVLNILDDDTTVRSLVSEAGFCVVDGCLGADSTVNGGIAWVHSRLVKGTTKVSSQQLVVTNSLLEQYQTVAKRNAAIDSYGGKQTYDTLTPIPIDDESVEPDPGPVPPSEYTLVLVLDPEDAGTYSINGEHLEVGEYEYPAGSELVVGFEAAGGWSFGGWKNRSETDPDITLILNSNTQLEAIVLED